METKSFTDQLNRTIRVNFPPQKIISTVPSQTELLFELDLEDEVIGITKFCIHPTKWFKTKTRVGGTKTLNITKINQLNPDLIIANKEENTKEQLEELAQNFPVWISDIENLEQSLEMINAVGQLTNRTQKADVLINQIENDFKNLNRIKDNAGVLYFIWREPLMVAGKNTFINDILSRLGFKNLALMLEGRYPSITQAELIELNPQYIFLSSEPYPFKEKHINELQNLLPNSNIKLVDGEMFSWYGSRLKLAPTYFNQLIKELP